MFRKQKLNKMANLVGGLLMALTGFIAMEIHRANSYELGVSMPYWLSYIGAFCFFIFGWISLGHNAGFGGVRSMTSAFRAMIVALMASCIIFGLIFIGGQLLAGFYLDPFKTVFAWFRVSYEYFLDTFTIPVWSALIVGSLVSGRLTGLANYHWR
jgi:hypothetical protein